MPIASSQQLGTLAQFFPAIPPKYPWQTESPNGIEFSSYRVLILEGSGSLARLLATGLSAELLAVDVSQDLESAMQRIEAHAYNLLILDMDLAGVDGLTLLGTLQLRRPAMRVLVLSCRGAIDAGAAALNGGADEYLMKPFSLVELAARVRVLRRRSIEGTHIQAAVPRKLVLRRDQCRVECKGRTVDLTRREFDLLEFMMQHAGKTLSRATLTQEVWNMPVEGNTNIVDVYMKYLRDKLEGAYEEKLIRTVRGVGYVFQEPV